jgi:diaminopropionate ammonia-lyase
MIPQVLPIRFLLNPATRPHRPYGPSERAILSLEAHEEAFREISSWDAYQPTPLLTLPGLAKALGVGTLRYKDEGARLGLKSFKALGGIYGVFRMVKDVLNGMGVEGIRSRDLLVGTHGDLTEKLTVTCASVGNHGQSVARGAAMFGCRAVIFLPAGTAPFRKQAIELLGARIIEVDGSWDDAVLESARRAESEGWLVVSDTAYAGYKEIPRHIMQGYTVMVREVLDQLPQGELPTHVFLQAGVGGLAAAVTAHLWEVLGEDRPTVAVVEPSEADCLLESALYGRPSPSRGTLDTSMDCLACREPSTLAWEVLAKGAHAFLTVPDYAVEETVTLLARGVESDGKVYSQPSGVAGLTGLIATTFEPALSDPLDLGEDSRVIIFGSEGPQ